MRLLIVSNRLPITVAEEKGQIIFKESAGGLVSGISAYLDSLKGSGFTSVEYVWIGWPGITADKAKQRELHTRLYAEARAFPVFLTEEEMENFYHGFCNKTIWPLFHYFPSYVVYDEDYWTHYKHVNSMFCNAIMEIVKPDDVIWVHDYHLMLLPKLLREKMPNLPIGFFLHIPFPDFEIFRLLPGEWRREILDGLLGANLIGFHTHDYTQYFLRCVMRILGYEHSMGEILLPERVAKAETFPMGIDFQKFQDATGSPKVKFEKEKFKEMLADVKIILSIDRLDYSKGIINRLRGYEIFLERNPQWRSKVVLVMVVVPSRIGVEHYQQMKSQIDEMTGKINGRFGTINWTPVLYQYKFLLFHPLVAVYNVSDVALVTPLRDGMNLIAKEYLATHPDKKGVLVLSEMAGAAKELGEAIIINPNNVEEIADALKNALEMTEEQQIKSNEIMQERLKRYNVVRWAGDFIQTLQTLNEEQSRFDAKFLGTEISSQLKTDYKKSDRRLLLLDYDGTLVPFTTSPQLAEPNEELLKILDRIGKNKKNLLVIISGRDKETLQNWFGNLNVALVAEHGVWIKEKDHDWKITGPLINDWKAQIVPILELFVDRVPGSFVEEKDYSIVWHYRKADAELGSLRAKELTDDLVNFMANIDVQVLQGSKVVEVRCSGANKGTAALSFLAKQKYDFILAIGDDWTDEDIFKVLPETAYSIRVGLTKSYASYNLRKYSEVIDLLVRLT